MAVRYNTILHRYEFTSRVWKSLGRAKIGIVIAFMVLIIVSGHLIWIAEEHAQLAPEFGHDSISGAEFHQSVSDDTECFDVGRLARLAREEGMFLGNSAGAAVKGLLQLKEHFTKDDVVVILFHDHGSRYVGKMFNNDWMREMGYLD